MRSRPLFELLGEWRISLSYYFITVVGAGRLYCICYLYSMILTVLV